LAWAGRSATQADIATWSQQLDSGAADRGDTLIALVNSTEAIELVGLISTSIITGG
jgi:hypothetical protein